MAQLWYLLIGNRSIAPCCDSCAYLNSHCLFSPDTRQQICQLGWRCVGGRALLHLNEHCCAISCTCCSVLSRRAWMALHLVPQTLEPGAASTCLCHKLPKLAVAARHNFSWEHCWLCQRGCRESFPCSPDLLSCYSRCCQLKCSTKALQISLNGDAKQSVLIVWYYCLAAAFNALS